VCIYKAPCRLLLPHKERERSSKQKNSYHQNKMSHTVVGGTHYGTRWVTRGDVDGGGLRESSWWYTTGPDVGLVFGRC